jgi:hypothetical protein
MPNTCGSELCGKQVDSRRMKETASQDMSWHFITILIIDIYNFKSSQVDTHSQACKILKTSNTLRRTPEIPHFKEFLKEIPV